MTKASNLKQLAEKLDNYIDAAQLVETVTQFNTNANEIDPDFGRGEAYMTATMPIQRYTQPSLSD